MIKKLLIFFFTLILVSIAHAEENVNISSTLMRSTFKIQEGKTFGTVFILGQPVENDPSRAYYVLFTAGHVLNSMKDRGQVYS